MREREQDIDPYWQEDLAIGDGHFYRDQVFTMRLRLHTSEERFYDHDELVPISQRAGRRTYVHARPYILEPDITVTLGVYPEPTESGAIGEILDSDWEGMRQQDIGKAQAWYYPAPDRLLMLWECYLYEWCRQKNPLVDENLKTLWTGFEHHLLKHFPQTQRIVTPSWEGIYDRSLWQKFLTAQGYCPFNGPAFFKEVER